jgi:release factor glutamine methyltransferase
MSTTVPFRVFSYKELKDWRYAISRIYDDMKTKSAAGPYEVKCDGIVLTVLPNVYAPRFFTDSLWFAQQLSGIVGDKSLLEIGTGTGLIAVTCAQNGARVVATDVNPDAVKNAQLNVARHHLSIPVLEGNLFDPVKPTERFDYIFWAHPFNNWEVPVQDMLQRSGMDYNYEGLRAYIAGAKHHLTSRGKLLLGTGDSADLTTVTTIAMEHGYRLRLLDQAQMPLEEGGRLLVQYLICELEGP